MPLVSIMFLHQIGRNSAMLNALISRRRDILGEAIFFNTMASLQYFSFTTAPLYHVMSASTPGTPNTAQFPALKSHPHGKNTVQDVVQDVYQTCVIRIVKWLQSGDHPRLHHHLQGNAGYVVMTMGNSTYQRGMVHTETVFKQCIYRETK